MRKGEGNIRNETHFPLGDLEVTSINEGSDEGSDVLNERGRDFEGGSIFDGLDGHEDNGGTKGRGLDLERRKFGSISIGLSDFAECLNCLYDDTTSLGIGYGVLNLDESGEELGEERSDSKLIVYELGHVVDNDSDLTNGRGKLLGESTGEEGSHEGKGRRIDLGNEGGGCEELDGVGDFLNGVDEGADESWNELFDILVGDESAKLDEGGTGGLLDVRLGVPDGIDHYRNNVGHLASALIRSTLY
jgi:hypothetical protein